MSRRPIGVLAAAGMLALLGAVEARAGTDAALVARELPPASGALRAARRFELVGLHWRGAGTVRFRTRAVAGRWTAWRSVDVDEHVDVGSTEAARTRGWRLGEPYWVGASDRIQWRTSGSVRRLRVYLVSSSSVAVPPRTLDLAGPPGIVMRSAWHADERIRRSSPRYAPAVLFAVVHHTAGTNAYDPTDSAAIVRAIEEYHVEGNGWNDIGYNFLVDKYGQVFEGRYGGITRNVVGAHAAGFNTGSVGVAVLGTYGLKRISAAAQASLSRLLAWRLDVAHVDPLSTLTRSSGGNGKYPPGTPVTLHVISGHRDTGLTDCPGNAFYAQLPAIAQSVAQAGLPKLYDPAVRGSIGGLVTFTARLSSSQAWAVTVRDPAGAVAGSGSGAGLAVRWTWDGRGARKRSYSWSIEAASVRPARGTLGTPAPVVPPEPLPPAMTDFSLSPTALSPDGDGYADAAVVTYLLRRAALVTARVLDAAGATIFTRFQDQRQSARIQSWFWTPDAVSDGRYTFEVSARGGDGKVVQVSAPVVVDRTLGFLSAQPSPFSPNGDGNLDTITFSFDLGAAATVAVRVVQYGREVALVFSGELQPGRQQYVWDGKTPDGPVPDGQYDLVVSATGPLGETSQSVRFTVDSRAQ